MNRDPDKERIAQEKFGRSYDELDTNQKKAVGGLKGGRTGGEGRKQQMAAQHGGDVSAAYSAMGKKGGQAGGQAGGEARKEQMAAEHGGDASAAYIKMGQSGGETRKDQMAAEHGGDASAGYAKMGKQGAPRGSVTKEDTGSA